MRKRVKVKRVDTTRVKTRQELTSGWHDKIYVTRIDRSTWWKNIWWHDNSGVFHSPGNLCNDQRSVHHMVWRDLLMAWLLFLLCNFAWKEESVSMFSIFRGPFITAMGKTWCPGCFLCSMDKCQRSLQEVGFVEEKSKIIFIMIHDKG